MTEVSKETSLTECNGDVSPEKEITEISDEVFTSDGLSKYHDTDVNPEDSFSEGNLDENKYSRASMICRDLAWSLEEDKHREGLQWEKIPPYGKVQETTRLKKSGTEKLLEERDGGIRGNEEFQVAEMEDNLEWLGSQQPRKDAMMTKQDKEVEDGEQEIDNDNEDGGDDDDDDDEEEDEVRLIEFKKGNGRASHFKEEGNVSEDSPLSSPNSQPITPEELPALGKKNDISRHTYSRYNTISYRKIKKGNTKQRIDEFESMLHL
uniref:Ermin n=1 Tax=Monodelphis domestica TaxID=13616 RepID=A0A5F8GAQ3_MONDO